MSDLHQPNQEPIKVKDDEILIIKQPDGNWKGYMIKNKLQIEVRDVDPYTCLTLLLTKG